VARAWSQAEFVDDKKELGSSLFERVSDVIGVNSVAFVVGSDGLWGRQDGQEVQEESVDVASPLLASSSVIRVGGAVATVLIDCGATHSILSEAWALQAELPLEATQSFMTTQYANEVARLEPLVRARKVELMFHGATGDVRVWGDFVVSKHLTAYDCVLGMPLLAGLSRKHALHIRFDSNELIMQQTADSPPITVVLRWQGERTVPIEFSSLNHMEVSVTAGEKVSARARLLEEELFTAYADRFDKVTAHEPSKFPFVHGIEFKDEQSVLNPSLVRYSVPLEDIDALKVMLDDWLARGIVTRSQSRFCSPAFLLNKKTVDPVTGRPEKRLVVDYRILNSQIKYDAGNLMPLRGEDMARVLSGYKIFSVMDIREGFYHVELARDSRAYTAFALPGGLGSFEWTRCPFGLSTSPTAFAQNLHAILADVKLKYPRQIQIFVDDIVVAAQTLEENYVIVKEIWDCFRVADVKLNKKKVHLFRSQVEFLGYVIQHDKISMSARAQEVDSFPTPQTKKQLRSFLEFASFFRTFLHRLAHEAAPLYALLGDSVRFEWRQVHQQAFERIKTALLNLPNLYPPSGNRDAVLLLYTDASAVGVSGCLCEVVEGSVRPLGFFSQALKANQCSLSVEDRELYAVVRSLEHFANVIAGQAVRVLCDCKPLVEALVRHKLESEKAKRFVSRLLQHRVVIQHHEGISNRADYLSRVFKPSVGDVAWEPVQVAVDARQVTVGLGLDTAQWVKAYQEDQLTKEIIGVLGDPRTEDHMWRKKYEIEDGLLFLRARGAQDRRLFVPDAQDLRQQVLSTSHDSLVAGHGGFLKTMARIRPTWYWPQMKQTVFNYVASCVVCARAKSLAQTKGPGHSLPVPTAPFEEISIDLVTGLPPAKSMLNGKVVTVDAVLTVVDRLTGYTVFVAVPKSCTGLDVANALIQHVFSVHCVTLPVRITSDRDPRWTSAAWRELASALGIHMALSTAHHPESNGACEARNKALGSYLRAMVKGKGDAWPTLLATGAMAINCSKSAAIGSSPAQARFGLVPEFPFRMNGRGSDAKLPDPLEHLREMQVHAWQCAQDAVSDARDREVRGHRSHVPRQLQAGDEVVVSTEVLLPNAKHARSKKLSGRFVGPYKVVRKVHSGAYEVDLPKESRAHRTISVAHLKRVLTTDEFPTRPAAGADEQEALMDYIVEKVLKHRTSKKKGLELRIRWLGYNSDYDSWEPLANFTDADGAVVNTVVIAYFAENGIVWT